MGQPLFLDRNRDRAAQSEGEHAAANGARHLCHHRYDRLVDALSFRVAERSGLAGSPRSHSLRRRGRLARAGVASRAPALRGVTEVFEQRVLAASPLLRVASHARKATVCRGTCFARQFGGEALLHRPVLRPPPQRALGRQAIAAGPARLLVERLQAARRLQVQHAADVAAVDAHAKRTGRHQQGHLAGREAALEPGAVGRQKARVVSGRLHAGRAARRRRLLHRLAGSGVDEGATCLRCHAGGLLGQPLQAGFERGRRRNAKSQVVSHRGAHAAQRALQCQCTAEVVVGRRRGRGGQRHARRPQRFF